MMYEMCILGFVCMLSVSYDSFIPDVRVHSEPTCVLHPPPHRQSDLKGHRNLYRSLVTVSPGVSAATAGMKTLRRLLSPQLQCYIKIQMQAAGHRHVAFRPYASCSTARSYLCIYENHHVLDLCVSFQLSSPSSCN